MHKMKSIVFAFLAYFILGTGHLPSATGLTAPYDVRWSLEKEHVIVKWKHQHKDEPARGYYVSVQEVQKGFKLGTPNFVHVKEGVRAAIIRGLKPRAVYEIKVIAYSAKKHEASAPVLVKTKNLEFMQARSLTVSSITATSAVFHWQHNPKNNIHDIRFKLVCSGVQHFIKDGEEMVERTELHHTVRSTSQRSESYQTNELEPNTQYSCHLTSVAGRLESEPSTQVKFTTTPGKPSPPPQPKVSVDKKGGKVENKSFTAELYPTDNHFGPISHYKVFAVPVKKDEKEPESLPYSPTVPLDQLPSHAVSSHLVSEVSDPIPFIIGQYSAHTLPEKLTFDGTWMRKAFKPETYYSIVVAAFTKTSNTSQPLYSFSKLADPPVYIGADMRQEWVKSHKPAARKLTITILATLFSVIGIFSLAFGVVFATRYYRGSRRDAYFFTIGDSDSSGSSGEEEIYQKSSDKKEEAAPLVEPLPAPTPNQTLAEWAVENLCYNPVFEETIYRSPETMKEMDDTLHTIADKYARRIAAIQAVKESRSPTVGAEPNTDKLTQLELEAETTPPMVTPCESLSEECPLPQLHTQSLDASTASIARLNATKPQWDTAAVHNSSSEYMAATRRGKGGEGGEDMQ